MNRSSYASIPTGHRFKINLLDEHEYWSGEISDGRATVALIKKHPVGKSPTYIAVWSFSDWNQYQHKTGDILEFQHTQTKARWSGELIEIITKDNLEKIQHKYEGVSVTNWTLK